MDVSKFNLHKTKSQNSQNNLEKFSLSRRKAQMKYLELET